MEFLSPRPLCTYDPFIMKGMSEGVNLIIETINSGHKICVYGDYDVDGITSVSILRYVLGMLSDNVSYYIPGRLDEGYGLNKDAIRHIRDNGVRLVITVDCGITSLEEVELAKKMGMEVIVTDHHNVADKLPDCIVINPKQKDCEYPFEGLAGCGIAFKLAQGIQRKARLPKKVINDLLDMAAIGTIGDIVPLVDENRTIVKYGINNIRRARRYGIEYLIKRIGKDSGHVTAEDISFNIVPSLNAAGRMGDADIAVEFFGENPDEESENLADKLLQLNKNRKDIQEKDYLRCVELYEKEYKYFRFPIIVLEGAHEGVAGIVAGKMKDYCHKPVAILTKKDDKYKGTSRGIDEVDIYKVLSAGSSLFEKFGGHKGACGFTMEDKNLELLRDSVEKYMNEHHPHIDYDAESAKDFDMELPGAEITGKMIEELELLEPYGAGNEKPVFMISGCRLIYISRMGADNRHLKFTAETKDGNRIRCICFNVSDETVNKMDKGVILDITGTLGFNRWKGRKEIQMMINNISFC